LKLIPSKLIVRGPTEVALESVIGDGPNVPVLLVVIADSMVGVPPTVTESIAAMVADFAKPVPVRQNLLPAAVAVLRILLFATLHPGFGVPYDVNRIEGVVTKVVLVVVPVVSPSAVTVLVPDGRVARPPTLPIEVAAPVTTAPLSYSKTP